MPILLDMLVRLSLGAHLSHRLSLSEVRLFVSPGCLSRLYGPRLPAPTPQAILFGDTTLLLGIHLAHLYGPILPSHIVREGD